jgi:hypothetical protein
VGGETDDPASLRHVIKESPEEIESRAGDVARVPPVSEAEDDIMNGVAVEMSEEFFEAEFELGRESRLVGLEEDADAVNLLVVGDELHNVLHVDLVLLDPAGVSDPRSVDHRHHRVVHVESVATRELRRGLALP